MIPIRRMQVNPIKCHEKALAGRLRRRAVPAHTLFDPFTEMVAGASRTPERKSPLRGAFFPSS